MAALMLAEQDCAAERSPIRRKLPNTLKRGYGDWQFGFGSMQLSPRPSRARETVKQFDHLPVTASNQWHFQGAVGCRCLPATRYRERQRFRA